MQLGTPLANGQSFKTQNTYSARGTSGYGRSDPSPPRDRHVAKRLHPLTYSESRWASEPERFARFQLGKVCRRPLLRGRIGELLQGLFDFVD